MRYCIITAFLCAIALSCLAESTVAERTDTKGYCVFGAWMLVSETAPDGKETSSIYTQYTRCKIYISSMRRRLYKKVFGKEGSGKDWDEFILSL